MYGSCIYEIVFLFVFINDCLALKVVVVFMWYAVDMIYCSLFLFVSLLFLENKIVLTFSLELSNFFNIPKVWTF